MDQKEKEEETVQEQKVQDEKAQEKNGTEEPKDWNSRREHRDQKEAGEKEVREDQEDMVEYCAFSTSFHIPSEAKY